MMKVWLTVLIILIFSGCYIDGKTDTSTKMIDLSNMSLSEIEKYAENNKLQLQTEEEYNENVPKGMMINQSIAENSIIKKGDALSITISLGPIPVAVYRNNMVNELGNVPVMMYHSIVNRTNDETKYTGGNVDKDGYNRTKEAFINDLELYYNNGYRMIRLIDYMHGEIDVDLGKSPIILTFDDGSRDNINVIGVDDVGNIVIDPNSAVGILEEFKHKYPDFNVTATFFINSGLFGQPKYNINILKWLIDNGYDIGNHTKTHVDFNKVDIDKTQEEVAYMYKMFDKVIPNKYIHVVALPFGSPGKKSHLNFPYILKGVYNDYEYITEGTLRVGWEPNVSPFHKGFDREFIKRVRAWDNNGMDFDIEMVFRSLNSNRYVSDGNPNTIVIVDDKNLNLDIKGKKIIMY